MAFQCDNDWQSTKKTVLERNSHMFNNPLMSDIKFTCGESKRKYFYAHKYVLATSSAVFFTMFYGDLAEKGPTIHLPDTDEETFEAFLRFLYTEDYKITAEVAIKVMYLAKKYIVPFLTEKCVEFFQGSLQSDNVVTVLEQALHFGDNELEKKCWQIVESKTVEVVSSEAFCHISQGTLISILKRDSLNNAVKEIELFNAVLKWSETACAKNGLEATWKNRREVIGDALYEIRFHSMSEKDFARHVSPSGLLTSEEIVPIYEKFNGIESASLKWKRPERYQSHLKHFKRCNLTDVKEPGILWKYGGNPDRLLFSVSKPATFHGVYLFGDDKGSEYEVSLRVEGAKVTGTYTSGRNSEGVYGFNVMLPTPISLEKNRILAMAATIRGPKSYFAKRGKEEVEHEGVFVTFGDWRYGPTNGTDKTGGQFYEVVLSMRGDNESKRQNRTYNH